MNIKSSAVALIKHYNDFHQLPLSPKYQQLPTYLLAYLQGAMARRSNKEAKPFTFSFQLENLLKLTLRPEHFGMTKGILIDREYYNLPVKNAPKHILDLGTNIGLSLLAFHDQFPDADIAGVEADPRNFDLLVKNIQANNLNVSVLSGAISESTGIFDLRTGRDSTCSTLIEGSLIHPGHDSSIAIPLLTMDMVLEYLGWEEIDILKIDIEGAEENLLKTSPEWLKRVGLIVMEIHPNTTPEKIASYLAPFGFSLSRHTFGYEPVYVAKKDN